MNLITKIPLMTFSALFLSLMLSTQAKALGGIDTLSDKNEKEMVVRMAEILEISKDQSYEIFKNFIQNYLDFEDWSAYWSKNDTLDNSKVVNSIDKFLFLTILNDNRVINLSLFKFSKEKQVTLQIVESLPRQKSSGLEKYEELKADKKFEMEDENSKFAYFTEKGMASKVNISIRDTSSLIQFVDLRSFNLN
ncbi:hypothetical protein THMIRHAS_03380 [Thiosulfatimonas sediminis]|uniref:Uncharacterized protein n=1 Tax=Thiosulfatimonas sediminis TaxID=2675054 RepID=A0A6F8PS71_9GAMM|nr:hypothetical protein THMIRHAS_03380 [Thiosulfatimonas sediminis]